MTTPETSSSPVLGECDLDCTRIPCWHQLNPPAPHPTGVIRMYQNGNTVDVQMPTYNEASELFHRLAHLTDIPDVHFSVWQASSDRDLAEERRVKR